MAECPHMTGDEVCSVCRELAELKAKNEGASELKRYAKRFRLRPMLITAGNVQFEYDRESNQVTVRAPFGVAIRAARPDAG